MNSSVVNFGKESIHSGQFMVSHFEAEDAHDDLDDSEILDPHLSKIVNSNACKNVQLYIPQKSVEYNDGSNIKRNPITSHLEIETSLTKLFKCMNLAYSQKLTSPKWNHFKGVRLRWKEKIRLNNVIWRCWHMQFILKKRTPVCQFASPLDVDTHINPQSVVLEGKYWKRQMTVIKAEYRKWRKKSKSKNSGCVFNDSRSEFDILEWSPLNEKNCMLLEDWTSDTLFSSINGPFPFPDPREIARGAGIAEFIQPSLGPLQPNLDDIDLTLADLIQSSRLPSVPEEISEENLKTVEYGFTTVLGSDEINPNHVLNVQINNVNEFQSNSNVDTNMIELNNSLNNLQYSNQKLDSSEVLGFIDESNKSLESFSCASDLRTTSINNQTENICNQSLPNYFITPHDNLLIRQNLNEFSGTSVFKGRISKNVQRPFRREPHNYDKAQPTPHQTTAYQQMLAEHHQENIQSLTQQPNSSYQQKIELRMKYPSEIITNSSLKNRNTSNTSLNSLDVELKNTGDNYFNTYTKQFIYSEDQALMTNVKVETNTKRSNDIFGSLKQPYFNTQSETIKKSSSTGTYLNIKSNDINHSYVHSSIQKLSQPLHEQTHSLPLSLNSSQEGIQQLHSLKLSQQSFPRLLQQEMLRSYSLPLSVSLHKIDNFDTQKSITKTDNSRSRSDSIHQHLSAADIMSNKNVETNTNDSILNSTLALLLKSQTNTMASQLSSTNVMTNHSLSNPEDILPADSGTPHNVFMAQSTSPATSHTSLRTTTQQNRKMEKSEIKSTSLPVPVKPNILHNSSGYKILSYPPPSRELSCSSDICISSEMFHEFDLALSPISNIKYSREKPRRVGHIHAEQKRRYNIKNGFDMLYSLIPQLQLNTCAKLSKAAMLHKGAEYIRQLRSERNALKEKMDILCIERDSLNNSLMHLQSVLPAKGAPLTRHTTEHVRQLYEQYVRFQTNSNWKFWILGLILEPLFASYISSVSSISVDEMRRTIFLWIDQHCSLVDLRPAVSNKLKYLSMRTDLLSDPPSTLQEEVEMILQHSSRQHPNLSGL